MLSRLNYKPFSVEIHINRQTTVKTRASHLPLVGRGSVYWSKLQLNCSKHSQQASSYVIHPMI